VVAIWSEARARHAGDGKFLFGGFCIADAMYAPVATRFQTYGVALADFGDDGRAAEYGNTLLEMPEMEAWKQGAEQEMAARAV
jgi:glutathione S-transferase